jgi:hypothetical protein
MKQIQASSIDVFLRSIHNQLSCMRSMLDIGLRWSGEETKRRGVGEGRGTVDVGSAAKAPVCSSIPRLQSTSQLDYQFSMRLHSKALGYETTDPMSSRNLEATNASGLGDRTHANQRVHYRPGISQNTRSRSVAKHQLQLRPYEGHQPL